MMPGIMSWSLSCLFWFNSLRSSDAYMFQQSRPSFISSVNDLAPARRQAIMGTSAGILSFEPLGTNFSEILIDFHTFSFRKMQLKVVSKMASILSRPQCVKKHKNIFAFSIISKHGDSSWNRNLSFLTIICSSCWVSVMVADVLAM